MNYAIFVTTRDGGCIRCEGPEESINELEMILAKAGYWINDDAGSWHNGFYGRNFNEPTVGNEVV